MDISLFDFFKKYDKKLVGDINALTDKLARGRVADFAEYRSIVGRIQGINDARGALADLLKNDDDQDQLGDID